MKPVFGPVYRAATRRWLYVKFLPPETRGELTTQVMIWAGLTAFFAWGLLGLVATPLS